MRGSKLEGGSYSTPDIGPRPRPWVRVIGSLSIFGFLIGLMIGRMFQPDPLWLDRVDVLDQGLRLWFNVEPLVSEEHFNGMYVLRMESFGREQSGELDVQGKTANWRIQRQRRDMVLRVLAARPLRGEWHADEVDGLWRLNINLREQ